MRRILQVLFFSAVALFGFFFAKNLVKPKSTGVLEYPIHRQHLKRYSEQQRNTLAKKVNLAWDRIEKQLKKVAPDSLRRLGGPASEQDFAYFQKRMAIEFPPDLEASLRRHNGSVGSFAVFQLNSVRWIMREHATQSHESIDTWLAGHYDSLFDHSKGHWEPGVFDVGENYFKLIVDRESQDETLIQSIFSYSGPHHDSYLGFLEYIANALESEAFKVTETDEGKRVFELSGWGCEHY